MFNPFRTTSYLLEIYCCLLESVDQIQKKCHCSWSDIASISGTQYFKGDTGVPMVLKGYWSQFSRYFEQQCKVLKKSETKVIDQFCMVWYTQFQEKKFDVKRAAGFRDICRRHRCPYGPEGRQKTKKTKFTTDDFVCDVILEFKIMNASNGRFSLDGSLVVQLEQKMGRNVFLSLSYGRVYARDTGVPVEPKGLRGWILDYRLRRFPVRKLW